MALDTIFQATILTNFIYPFLLAFLILFAILDRSKLLGENKQINALVSAVVSLVFVGAVFPKVVVGNLILFLAVGAIVIFVIMLLWGFVTGKSETPTIQGKVAKVVAIIIIIGVILVVLGSVGFGPVGDVLKNIGNFLFSSSWSSSFWANFLFVAIVVGALVVVLVNKGKSD